MEQWQSCSLSIYQTVHIFTNLWDPIKQFFLATSQGLANIGDNLPQVVIMPLFAPPCTTGFGLLATSIL